MDFDEILAKCGDCGRYQIMLLFLFGLVNIFVSMHYFKQTVISFVPDHWCYHEKLENKTFDEIAAIYEEFKSPSCTLLLDIDDDNVTVSSEKCTKWIYKYEYGYKSMNTELNWVCDDAYKARIGQSLFFIGSIVGTLIIGMLSDKFGRLRGLIISHVIGCIGDVVTIFGTNVTTFCIYRFISGIASDTNLYLMYIIVLEYIRPSMRTLGINLVTGIFYSLGLVITPWIAAWVGDWQHFLAYTSIPVPLIIFYYFIVQESAQWLVTRNNIEGAIRRLKCVAKINKREVSELDFKSFQEYCELQHDTLENSSSFRHASVLDLFRTPNMRKRSIILFFKTMVIGLCFDVVSRNVEGMGFSPFILFSITASAVLPASLILIPIQDRIGRKAMAASALLVGGIFTSAAGVAIAYQEKSHNAVLLAALSIAARFGVAIAYESGTQYVTELMPTCMRAQGVAAAHIAGFAATFVGPYILWLGTFFKPGPSIILGVLFFFGSYVCLLLPETHNKILPMTIEESEVFGQDERMFDFPCCSKIDDDDEPKIRRYTKIIPSLKGDSISTINVCYDTIY